MQNGRKRGTRREQLQPISISLACRVDGKRIKEVTVGAAH